MIPEKYINYYLEEYKDEKEREKIKALHIERYKNALNKTTMINELLEKGHIVFRNNEVINGKYYNDNGDIYWKNSEDSNCSFQCFEFNPHYDHGLWNTVEEFNKDFGVFSYVKKEDIQALEL